MILLKKEDYDKKASEIYDLSKQIIRAEIENESVMPIYKQLRETLQLLLDDPENKDFETLHIMNTIKYDILCKYVFFRGIKDYLNLRKLIFEVVLSNS